MFLVLAIVAFFSQWLAVTPFVMSGERLTFKYAVVLCPSIPFAGCS
jgi:hypothetical protein